MKKGFILFLLGVAINVNAQTLITPENDTTIISEYNDGRVWGYRIQGDVVVGMTNYKEKTDYGKYYQIIIFIKNLGDNSILFDPSEITSEIYDKKEVKSDLLVYTHERFMKKVKRTQAWSMALLGFASGLNAGTAGYQTTYTTTYSPGSMPYTSVSRTYNPSAASAANIAATTQMITLDKMMKEDGKIISEGYLKKTTIHADEGVLGYVNIKYKKGENMIIYIPVNGNVYKFDWDVSNKK